MVLKRLDPLQLGDLDIVARGVVVQTGLRCLLRSLGSRLGSLAATRPLRTGYRNM